MQIAPDKLHDLHCHLDFMSNATEICVDAHRSGSHIFANTVTPAGYDKATQWAGRFSNVHLGLGLHPWYLGHEASIDEQLQAFDSFLDNTEFVGEVGLDFSIKKIGTADVQTRAFRHIAVACGSKGGKLLSVHAIQSADAVLDILAESGAAESCDCIMHWFSGSSEQLHRAIDMGCYFSVGPLMVASRRGREYAKQIPLNRLMLETDYPPTSENLTYDPDTNEPRVPFSFAQIATGLNEAAATIIERKGKQGADAAKIMSENALRLLNR